MSPFIQYLRDNTEWLYCVIVEYNFFYIDLWSIVHLWSGVIIFVVLTALNIKKRWVILLLLLSIFEIVENSIFIAIMNVFKPEKIVDVFNDIVIGMLGGYLIHYYYKLEYIKKPSKWMAIFISAISIAFVWVGRYGYSYSVSFFNSPYINWWALICWTFSGMAIIYIFSILKDKKNYIFTLASIWLIYLTLLFAAEYINHHLLSFRVITKEDTPLILDILHGSKNMHVFYVTAPLLFIGLYILFKTLLKKYEEVYVE